jgi:diguanylate cyclase (GGDEF)-like protein
MLRVYSCITQEHDFRLVLVAGGICLLAAFTAFSIFEQGRRASVRRWAWVALAGFIAGTGIWATHFVAMLAYQPHLPVGYDLNLTLVSIGAAMLITSGGWWAALSKRSRPALLGGAAVGAGISAMHYLGMAAVKMPGRFAWNPTLVCVSVLLGVGLTAAALAEHRRRPSTLPWRPALLFTLAICGMHFTAMAAASVYPDSRFGVPAEAIDSATLTVGVVVMALVILAIGFLMVLFDRKLAHIAFHDSLTGLPNRAVFTEHLGREVAKARDAGEPVAVLCIGLDGFKAVNDLYGHPAGDALLVAAAQRLRAAARCNELVARLGGDEFAIVQCGGSQPDHANRLTQRILAVLAEPFEIAAETVRITGSVGLALYPADAARPEDLIKNADVALYRAKAEGRGGARFYEAAMDESLRQRRQLDADLRQAIARRQLGVHYQPLADLESGRIVGFEALLRWTHPKLGEVSPATFIPLAEESGIILKLGEWVLREACSEAARWTPPLKLSVNLSPVQFAQGDLAGLVETVVAETGLDPARLDLEVTEGLLIKDAERAIAILERLKALGVKISMDDFGTGYSSLSYFRMFPFDKVKIDQSFIHDMIDNPQARAIIRSVIGLGRGLGMPVVAEGVETNEQLDALRAEGCDQVQGYLISRPGPIGQFEGVVVDRRAANGAGSSVAA